MANPTGGEWVGRSFGAVGRRGTIGSGLGREREEEEQSGEGLEVVPRFAVADVRGRCSVVCTVIGGVTF